MNMKRRMLLGTACSFALMLTGAGAMSVMAVELNLTKDDITYKQAEAPEAANEDGVISADEWKAQFPNQFATYWQNENNTIQTDYLEESPYLSNIYEGYGFAIDYKSARGHSLDLEDVHETARPHATANCLTCKTPNFTKLVNDIGVEAYTYDFEEVYATLNEPISCYNCHGNEVGAEADSANLVVTHSYTANAFGDNISELSPENLSCGQCHTEYYFKPDTKETSVPYTSASDMTPEAALAYYNEIGFTDWVQESTGTNMLKVQHPEFETVQQSIHTKMGVTCADCHMAVQQAADGTVYSSHNWESPLENEALLNTCATCHGDTDMAEKVHAIQETVTAREDEVGYKLSDLKDTLAAAVAEGTMTEEQLDEVRALYRDAQFYWDYSYVENSEGAHNSALDLDCLDRAEELCTEAMALLEA